MTSAPANLVAALASLALAGVAIAQATADESNLLAGPTVTDTPVPGVSDAFIEGPATSNTGQRRADPALTMRAFARSVQRLDAPGVEPELRLTDDQRAVIEVMLREHKQALADWRAEHKDELRQLRAKLRPGDKPRGKRAASVPARGDQSPREGRPLDRRLRQGEAAERTDGRIDRARLDEQTRAQLQSLMATRPGAEERQARIWETLTSEQRRFVEQEIERLRADNLARRDMLRQRRNNADNNAASKDS